MKRVLLMGAAAAAFGLGLTVAQASPRVVETTLGLKSYFGAASDVSAAKKKKKKRMVRGGRDGKGTGGGRGGESGSGAGAKM